MSVDRRFLLIGSLAGTGLAAAGPAGRALAQGAAASSALDPWARMRWGVRAGM